MLDLDLLPEEYAVCRLPAGSALPASLGSGPDDKSVISVTWAPDELSVICPADRVPEGAAVVRVRAPFSPVSRGVQAQSVR